VVPDGVFTSLAFFQQQAFSPLNLSSFGQPCVSEPPPRGSEVGRFEGNLGSRCVTSSVLSCRLEASVSCIPLASSANLVSGIANSVKPQSMQTRGFGNTQTTGLSRPSRPGKWRLISAPNCSWFCDVHDLHVTASLHAGPGSVPPEVLSYLKCAFPPHELCHAGLNQSDDDIARHALG
jgi:hypothetical protein